MTTLHGIDISHWQTGLDIAKTDAQFVIIKATEGTNYVDPACNSFYSKAKSLGLPRGVYHFYRGGGSAEADWFVKNVAGYVGDAILALDFEDHTTDVKGAKAFLDRVKSKTGVRPVIYMSASVLHSNNWSSVASADYGLWLARWGSDSAGDISPWKSLALWQYTDAHKSGGMTLDGDRFYGDKSTWAAYAGDASVPDHNTDDGDDHHTDHKVPSVDVDGVWGAGTTKQRQVLLTNSGHYTGDIDGVVSHQNPYWKGRNPGLGSGWDWESDYTAHDGSKTIRADQQRLAKIKGKDGQPLYRGAVDGLAGEDYFRALQREQQTTVDGVVSRPSAMVKAMQTDGNKGHLS